MRKIIYTALVSLFCFNANASETYQCMYSIASIEGGRMGQMSAPSLSNVEILGQSIKLYRPDGSATVSPPLTKNTPSALMSDDGIRVYAESNNKESFAVSDRIKKTTEQWDKCSIEQQTDTKNVPIQKPSHWERRAITKAEIRYVESAVKDRLKDPYSAKFKHSYYVSNGKGAYCGFVNSKNSFGGYVGDTPFMAIILHDNKGRATGAGVISVGGDSDETLATYQTCQDNGYFQ